MGWTQNTGGTGLVVTGSGVTAYGLAVEHYQKNEVVWSGQGGTDIFFQNELPYDVPSQSAWMATPDPGRLPRLPGQPERQDVPGLRPGQLRRSSTRAWISHDAMAFQAPKTPGVQFHDVFGVSERGSGGINSVINGTGGAVNSANPTAPATW